MNQEQTRAVAGLPRRAWMLGGVGVAAAVAGAGAAWWSMRPVDAGASAAPEGFWGLSFSAPQGGQVSMSSFQGRHLLLNFWATWCPPCVEELPLLDRFSEQKTAKGWQVLGLAIDQPSAVRQFLARTPVRFPIGLAGLEGTDLGRSLGNLSGGLPFTVVFGPDGRVRQRRMGKLSEADLTQWAAAA